MAREHVANGSIKLTAGLIGRRVSKRRFLTATDAFRRAAASQLASSAKLGNSRGRRSANKKQSCVPLPMSDH